MQHVIKQTKCPPLQCCSNRTQMHSLISLATWILWIQSLNLIVSFSPSFNVTHFRESFASRVKERKRNCVHSFIRSLASHCQHCLLINTIWFEFLVTKERLLVLNDNNANKVRSTFDSMLCKCFLFANRFDWFEIKNENSLRHHNVLKQLTLDLKLFSSQVKTSPANQFELISHNFVVFAFAIQIDIIS